MLEYKLNDMHASINPLYHSHSAFAYILRAITVDCVRHVLAANASAQNSVRGYPLHSFIHLLQRAPVASCRELVVTSRHSSTHIFKRDTAVYR